MLNWLRRKRVDANDVEIKRQIQPLDNDGVARVFSNELFDDPVIGAALREAGYGPDARANIIETQEDRERRAQQSALNGLQRELAEKERLSALHGPVQIMAFPIIPIELWTQDADGTWLQEMMDYEPFEEWNMLTLPIDEYSSKAMELPLHPRTRIPAIEEIVSEFIKSLRQEYGNEPAFDDRRVIKARVMEEISQIKPLVVDVLQKSATQH